MNLLKTTAVLACLLGTPIATADIYQHKDCDGNGTLLLTELDAEPDVDLSGLYLGCANLSFADLRYANLSDADLSYANLFEADLSGAELTYADLTYAGMPGVRIAGADLSYADLSYADLSFAEMWNADLTGANLTGVNLHDAMAFDASLSGADLTGADLTGAGLDGADLTGANLSGADLSEAVNWEEATWTGATYDEDTVLPEGMDPDVYGLVWGGPPLIGACCLDDGACSTVSEDDCIAAGGSYNGNYSDCDTAGCNTGACCFLKEFCYWECLELSEEDCMAEYAATWYGIGSRCEDITCPDPCVGACCLGGSQCVLTVQALCEAQEGTFHAYKMCDEIECECPGDLNGDGVVNILDLLKVINYWGACP